MFKWIGRIEQKLDYIIKVLLIFHEKGTIMSQELTDLVTQVKATADTDARALVAIQGLVKQVADLAAAGGTTQEFKDLAAQLKAATDPLAAAIPPQPTT